MSDAPTIAVYDGRAADYAAMTDDYNGADPRLAAFIAACPSGGRVLDLGCGPGAAAAEMARAGLQVEALDASATMVAMAARHAGVSARQGTFDDIEGCAIYNGIWANFSLLHAPRADLPRHLAALHRALKPGGAFLVGMKLGEGSARDRLGRLYTYVGAGELEELLAGAGFTVTGRVFGSGTGLDGSHSDWISVAAHG
jgi:SAM-dependent methyltransferase